MKPGTLPALCGGDEERHTLSSENKDRDPRPEAPIDTTLELGLMESGGK